MVAACPPLAMMRTRLLTARSAASGRRSGTHFFPPACRGAGVKEVPSRGSWAGTEKPVFAMVSILMPPVAARLRHKGQKPGACSGIHRDPNRVRVNRGTALSNLCRSAGSTNSGFSHRIGSGRLRHDLGAVGGGGKVPLGLTMTSASIRLPTESSKLVAERGAAAARARCGLRRSSPIVNRPRRRHPAARQCAAHALAHHPAANQPVVHYFRHFSSSPCAIRTRLSMIEPMCVKTLARCARPRHG